MKQLSLAILTFLSLFYCNAQNGQLSGVLLDKSSKGPISYVTVSIHNIKDSILVDGTITDKFGKFTLYDIPLGKQYLLICSFIGYNKIYRNVDFTSNKSINLGKIFLKTGNETLKDITINAYSNPISYEVDKKIINVEQMINVSSQTAIELLANIPSISVDMDGNVALRGSQGFTLLIDGRPTIMTSSEALQLIQASNIKSIEVITNPSAKYDAEGTSGIINVILKKNKLEGLSTIINCNGSNTGNGKEFWNYGTDFLTSINKRKIKFNIGGQFVEKNRFKDILQKRQTNVEDDVFKIEGNGIHRNFGKNYGFNAATEYIPNKSNFLNLSVNIRNRQWNSATNYFFDEYSNDSLINSYENRERSLRDFFALSTSFSFQHTFNENVDHYLSITSTHNLYDGDEDVQAEFFNLNKEFQGGYRNTEFGPSNSTRVSLDYQYPLGKNSKFLIGTRADFSLSRDDQDAFEFRFSDFQYVRLDSFSTDVEYFQNVYAGYSIFSGEFFSKIGYQFGIRSEYTDRWIKLTDNSLNTEIKRLDMFPSAHISYKIDNKNHLRASASRRINRPKSWHLEPFIAWENPFTVRQGNPNLLPEYIKSFEVGYIKNLDIGSFSTELYFRNVNNIRTRIQEVYDINVIIKRPVNAGVSSAIGIESSFNSTVKELWISEIGTNFFYYKIKGEIFGSSLNQETFTYTARWSNSFILANDLKVQFVSNYVADVVNVQGIDKGYISFDLAVKKDFHDGKVASTLQIRNLFASQRRESWVDTPTLYSYRLATPRWLIAALSISVKLNNFNSKDKIETEEGFEF